jgi:hypothetical protein
MRRNLSLQIRTADMFEVFQITPVKDTIFEKFIFTI